MKKKLGARAGGRMGVLISYPLKNIAGSHRICSLFLDYEIITLKYLKGCRIGISVLKLKFNPNGNAYSLKLVIYFSFSD